MGRRHEGKDRAMRKRVLVAVLLACALAVGGAGVGAAGATKEEETYLLTFDDNADADAVLAEVQRTVPVTVERTFGTVIRGAVVTTAAVPEAIDMVPGVATVDKDVEITLPEDELVPVDEEDPDGTTTSTSSTSTTSTTTTSTLLPDDTTTTTTTPPKPVVPWGLDRTDQRALPLSDSYTSPHDGSGVIVYVLDSGISPHPEFGDRLKSGADFVRDGFGTNDCNGHGTHVAGTIGGANVGIASGVTLVSVRVLNCEGATLPSTKVEAMDWIVAHHPAGQRGIVNYSAGGTRNGAAELAVRSMTAAGITLVIAGGNEDESACLGSMGTEVPGVLVVGWTTPDDSRSSDSNHGPCLDLFAPGEDIVSASAETGGLTTLSGTSMAAPHVTGAAAVILAQDPWRTPAQVEAAVVGEATGGIVKDPGDLSPNRLLYVDPERAPSPPTADTSAPAPPPSVLSTGGVDKASAQSAVLALTGGDPRALLTLGSLLLIAGMVLVAAARRRTRDLTPAMAAPTTPPLSGFEFQHRRRLP